MKKEFAVIFDMDGVVVDNYEYHRDAWTIFSERYNLDFGDAFRSKVFGGTNRDHLEFLFGRKLTGSEVRRYEEEKESIYRDLYRPYISPVEGLVRLLQILTGSGIPVALATSSPGINVRFVLEQTGTGRYFRTILDAASITNGKPDPEIYLKAAGLLETDPSRCIVFEDSVNGIKAAQAAGMKVIALTTTHPSGELPPVDLSIADFEEIGLPDLEKLV